MYIFGKYINKTCRCLLRFENTAQYIVFDCPSQLTWFDICQYFMTKATNMKNTAENIAKYIVSKYYVILYCVFSTVCKYLFIFIDIVCIYIYCVHVQYVYCAKNVCLSRHCLLDRWPDVLWLETLQTASNRASSSRQHIVSCVFNVQCTLYVMCVYCAHVKCIFSREHQVVWVHAMSLPSPSPLSLYPELW